MEGESQPRKALWVEASIHETVFMESGAILFNFTLSPRSVPLRRTIDERDSPVLEAIQRFIFLTILRSQVRWRVTQISHVGVLVKNELAEWVIIVVKLLVVYHDDKVQPRAVAYVQWDAFAWVIELVYLGRLVNQVLRRLVKDEDHVKRKES